MKPSPVRVERHQERSFVRKMYLKKCLQSIGLCVHCCSSQFVSYLFHGHRLMVLSDDGLVQVAWIKTIPLPPHLASLGMSLKRPKVLAQPVSVMISSSIKKSSSLSIASLDSIGTFLLACVAGLTEGSILML